ncbi:DNA polymerase zeta processivity subunit [Pleurostoma richardsiae]|uniref:DNA polymerase zeta processivity subunit n=1 Tax=Pleurostoma richardsiae TaxID=41990 RepID=A0AA38RQ23_9PEZI|nr:DNA polymerase zeta processivity subunit [Pleurostoma richardsiae]
MAQIAGGNVARVAVVIHAPLTSPDPQSKSPSPTKVPPGSVLERWMFDVSGFPPWPGGADGMKNWNSAGGQKHHDDGDDSGAEAGEEEEGSSVGAPATETADTTVNWEDVDEQLRGAVGRIAHAGESLDDLPDRCTFTVAVELREDGKPPIGHPQPWIPSQPNLQPASESRREKGKDLGGEKTTPIRSVEAGPLFFECWLEEGKAKDALRHEKGKESGLRSSNS